MLSRVFDVETGRIYDENSLIASDAPAIVNCVRQICNAFKKVELDCTPEREQSALKNFVTTEHSFEMFSLPREEREHFIRVSSVLWDNMLRDLRVDMLFPRHGPGATADRITGNQKYVWRRWHERLEPYFPLAGNGYAITDDIERVLEGVTFVPAEQEQPVRVTLVPKTLKGPRIIAIEPCCMQYAQQGIRDALYRIIESALMSSGSVNFKDQGINQRLAMSASIDGQLATIDLSDASDRVPHDLALEMFRGNHDLMEAVDACRSTHAEMPDGQIIGPLRKFASMGSALCFPVEAMYFYTICVMAILREQNLPVTRRNAFMVKRLVHVYGDDIVVPATYAVTVLDHLRKYNCKVNTNKTFFTGKFRESCGMDAFLGYDVTPTYIRRLAPKDRRHAQKLVSWVATANLFEKKGYFRTSQLMFSRVEKILGPLPYVSETSPALGRVSLYGYRRPTGRWNPKLQRLEIKAWVPTPVYRTDALGDHGALTKSLLKLEGLTTLRESRDASHLEHFALHGEVAIQRRWVPAS
jgi:hypothetical protein